MKQKELLSEVGDTAQGSKGRRAEQQAKGKGPGGASAKAKGTHPPGGHRRQGGHQGYQQPPWRNYQQGGYYHQGGSGRGWGGHGHW